MSSSDGAHCSTPVGPSGDAGGTVQHDSTHPGEAAIEIETEKFHSEQQVLLSKSDDTDCRAGDLTTVLLILSCSCALSLPTQEIVYYSAGHDAYLVWHANGRRFWFPPALVEAHVLDAWAEYRLKRKREDEQEAKLTEQALETVSEEPVFKRWDLLGPHNTALKNDKYVRGALAGTDDPKVYSKYPPRAMRNGHNVPYLASQMQGVLIMNRTAMTVDSRGEPPDCVKEAITKALKLAFDGLPESEKPEYKARLGLFDDFGQHKLNLGNASHSYRSANAYERLYLDATPGNSQRQSKKLTVDAESKSRSVRYDDEFEACFPLIGIALGRREIVEDGTAYLNWAERKAQLVAAERAGLQPWQTYPLDCT